MPDPFSRHPLAPTTAQRDANYHHSQKLTGLQNDLMNLTKQIEETSAEHQREPPARIPTPLFSLRLL
ncbi:hypothetical protein BDW02DRAFT_569409 [Decorospora gaudefroyi]|uniref:Uncharacterized protein n=1 Tax=Decorospora gaudefroyi TaxID=184978 RepID=A0A6A5KF60_9PLEO|nr:hypothetical protein BDW02DRAFT_569409 [Decorospora gaudefroyi]